MGDKKEYTIKEVAEILDISKSTVRRRIKDNELKATKRKTRYGQQYFIPASEINQAIRERSIVNIKEVNKPISQEDLMNELVEAVNSQNKELIGKVMENINQVQEQNTYLKQQIYKLTEEVKKLKKEKNKPGLLDRIKGFLNK